jgi:hypothetical protein
VCREGKARQVQVVLQVGGGLRKNKAEIVQIFEIVEIFQIINFLA